MAFGDQPFPSFSRHFPAPIPRFHPTFDPELLPIEDSNGDSNPIICFLVISSSICTVWLVDPLKTPSRVLGGSNFEFMAVVECFYGAFDPIVL